MVRHIVMSCYVSGDPGAETGNSRDSEPWVTLDLFLGYCGRHEDVVDTREKYDRS
jgi:hypothetical protein